MCFIPLSLIQIAGYQTLMFLAICGLLKKPQRMESRIFIPLSYSCLAEPSTSWLTTC